METDSRTTFAPGTVQSRPGDANSDMRSSAAESSLYHGVRRRGTVETATMPPTNPQRPSQMRGKRLSSCENAHKLLFQVKIKHAKPPRTAPKTKRAAIVKRKRGQLFGLATRIVG